MSPTFWALQGSQMHSPLISIGTDFGGWEMMPATPSDVQSWGEGVYKITHYIWSALNEAKEMAINPLQNATFR